jgi:hypothetical protein
MHAAWRVGCLLDLFATTTSITPTKHKSNGKGREDVYFKVRMERASPQQTNTKIGHPPHTY